MLRSELTTSPGLDRSRARVLLPVGGHAVRTVLWLLVLLGAVASFATAQSSDEPGTTLHPERILLDTIRAALATGDTLTAREAIEADPGIAGDLCLDLIFDGVDAHTHSNDPMVPEAPEVIRLLARTLTSPEHRQLADALDRLREGEDAFESIDHPFAEAIRANLIGSAASDEQRIGDAVTSYARAMEICRELGLPLATSHVAGSVAYLFRYHHDQETVLRALDLALGGFESMDFKRYAATCYTLRANAYQSLDRMDECRRDYERAVATAQASGDVFAIRYCTAQLVYFYINSDEVARAEATVAILLELADRSGLDTDRRVAERLLGDIARDRDDVESALAHYRSALDLAESDWDRGVGHSDIGMALFSAGQLLEARASLEHGIAMLDTIPEGIENLAWALDVLGQVEHEIPDYPRAIEFTARTIPLYRRLEWSGHAETQVRYVANIRNDYGIALGDSGRVEEAREQYMRANEGYAELGDVSAQVIVWGNLAIDYEDATQLAGAEEAYGKVLELLEQMGDDEQLEDTLNELSDVQYRRGNFAGAALVYRRMADHKREAGDLHGYSVWLGSMARSLRKHSDYVGAQAVYDEALIAVKEIPDPLRRAFQEGVMWNGLAVVLSDGGQREASFAQYELAAARFDSLDTVLTQLEAAYPDSTPSVSTFENLEMLVNAQRNMLVERLVSDDESALAEFAALQPVYIERLNDPVDAAEVSLNIHWWLEHREGTEPDSLWAHLDRGLAILDAVPEDARGHDWWQTRGVIHYEQAEIDERLVQLMLDDLTPYGANADSLYEKAGGRVTENYLASEECFSTIDYGVGRVDARTGLMNFVLILGDEVVRDNIDSTHVAGLDRTLDRARAISYDSGLLFGLRVKAKFQYLLGDPVGAVETYHEAIEVLESMVSRYGATEERRDALRTQYEDVYSSSVVLHLEQGMVREAMEVLDRSRSRELLELYESSEFSFDSEEKAQAYEELRGLLTAKLAAERAAEAEAAKPKKEQDATALARLRAQRAKAQRDYNAYVGQLMGRHPEIVSYLSVQPANLQGLERHMPDTMAVVQYLPMDTEMIIFVALPGEPPTYRKVPVVRADLDARITRFRELLSNGKAAKQNRQIRWSSPDALERAPESVRELIKLSAELRKDLIDPIEDIIAGYRILGITPSRMLHYLPFEALVRSDEEGFHFLVQEYGIFYFTMASFLEVFGSFAEVPRESLSLLAFAPDNPDLPHTAEEVELVAEVFDGRADIITGIDATEDAAYAGTGNHSVIHFATHGDLYFDDPQKSNLMMTRVEGQDADGAPATGGATDGEAPVEPGDVDSNDGRLTIGEIFGLDLGQSVLVTLSACETALGPQATGGEITGLAQAFMRFGGGVPSVVASLWRVDDEATAELMAGFYSGLLNETQPHSRLDALQEAKLMLLEDPYFAHPYFWAPFVLIGDCR